MLLNKVHNSFCVQAGTDGAYAGYPQQGTWQGYGQSSYNYGNAGTGTGQQAQQNK